MTPRPSTPTPTWTATPAATALAYINTLRATPLARYTGMDAYAEQQADAHTLVGSPDYAAIVSSTDGVTWDAYAYELDYAKAGIGYHDGYWVLVLNY